MATHAEVMDADGYWRQFEANWYPDQPGDLVEGFVKELVTARRGDPPAIKVQTKEGRIWVVVGRQARLRTELVKAAPTVGDRIRITYVGEAAKAVGGLNKAKEFTVEVKRAPGPRGGTDNIRGSASENASGAGS